MREVSGLREQDVSDSDWSDWCWQLRNSSTTAGSICALSECKAIESVYPTRITPYYLGLADQDNPHDPILRQCVPQPGELMEGDTGCPDPFGEEHLSPVPGLVQRYPDRALVMPTPVCAVNCRHCTRKNLLRRPGRTTEVPVTAASRAGERILEYIETQSSIREVILSGGDPLLLADSLLDDWLRALQAIAHIEVLRIGTRVPVVLPMRVDEDLVNLLARHRPLWINTQFNHPRELTAAALEACERLITRGIPVSNQAVLLKGINDDVAVIKELCNELQRHMIRPYYVFLCDPVQGTGCFSTGIKKAREVAQALETSLGGLAKPRFVMDVPGAPSKVPVCPIPAIRED